VTGHVLGDFAKSDAEWLEPFLAAIGEHAPLLAKGEDSTFMNRIALAVAPESENGAKANKGQSHVRQARPKPAPELPQSGPMAAMLKKLFGGGAGQS
jgi:PTH1 family peptidyl-tRNA hydrolase